MRWTAGIAALAMVIPVAGGLVLNADGPEPPAASVPPRAVPRFEPDHRSLGFPEKMPDAPPVSLVDVDGDGRVDVIVASQLWQNLGKAVPARGPGFKHAATLPGDHQVFGDLDSDGDLDLFASSTVEASWVPHEHHEWLWRNDGPDPKTGAPRFADVTAESGIAGNEGSKAAAWLDYDRDGALDIYVSNYEIAYGSPHHRYLQHRLFRGLGRGKFADVTEKAGLGAGKQTPRVAGSPEWNARPGMGVKPCDYDGDGWIDIYVANYRLEPNYLWRNNGDGTFTDVAAELGVTGADVDEKGEAAGYAHSNSCAWVDHDGDGDLDLWVSNLAHGRDPRQCRSKLFQNDGKDAAHPRGRFTDVTREVGLHWEPAPGMFPEHDWTGAAWADVDNDGFLDLFAAESCQGGGNSTAVPEIDGGYSRLYMNAGGKRFERADTADNHLRIQDSWGAAAGDLDGDGLVDLAAGSNSYRYPEDLQAFDPAASRATLLLNRGVPKPAGKKPVSNHWLAVRLAGKGKPLENAVVRVTLDDGRVLVRLRSAGYAGYSNECNVLHFGLGPGRAKQVEATLMDGTRVRKSGPFRNEVVMLRAGR